MGFENFNLQDLTQANLPNLIADLNRAKSNKDYNSIRDLAIKLAKEFSKAQIAVEEDGRRTITVGNEVVDLDNAISSIAATINGVNSHAVSPAAVAAIQDMFKAVDSQLTALFKQKEMMDELRARGFSAAEFEKSIQKSNSESKKKIEDIKKEQEKMAKLNEKRFGKDSDISGTTSLLTKKNHLKNANEAISIIFSQLKEIKDLKEAIDLLNTKIADGSIRPEIANGLITANKNKISAVEANIKGNLGSIKEAKIPGIDLSSIEGAVVTGTKPIDDAINSIGIDPISGAITSGIGVAGKILEATDKNYKEIGKAIVKTDKSIVDPDKTAIEGGDKVLIDKYIKELKDKEDRLVNDKAREEILIVAREKSLQDYLPKHQKFEEAEKKLQRAQDVDSDGNPLYYEDDGSGNPTNTVTTTVTPHKKYKMVQAKDPSGNPLYITPDGTGLTTTDTGNPYLTYVMEAKDKAALMADFKADDKEKEINAGTEITAMWDQKIPTLGHKDKQAVLKAAGIGNAFTRWFRAWRKLDASKPAIRTAVMNTIKDTAIDTKRKELLDKAREEHLETKTEPIVKDYEENIDIVRAFQDQHKMIQNRATIQQRMQDGAYDVVDNNKKTNSKLVEALNDAAYEQLALAYASSVNPGLTPVLTDVERNELESHNYSFENVVTAKTKKIIGSESKNPRTPDYYDR